MTILKKFCLSLFVIALMVSCGDHGSVENQGEEALVTQEDRIAELSDMIIESPNDPNLYIKRAMIYRDKQLFQLGIRDVERALAIDSTVSYFHEVLGEIEFSRGELRSARLSLEKAISLDETNTDALLKLAEVYFLLRRYDEALETTNLALKTDDKLAQGYFIKGFVYKEIGDTSLAKSSFQTAIEVNPSHYEAFMQLGSLYAFQGDPLALEYFNSALEVKPKSAEAYYHKGMFLQAGSKFEEALNTYRQLIEADPDNFLAYYNSGFIHLTEFLQYDTAAAYFDTVLTIQPNYVEAIYNRGLCYEELGREDAAVEAYRQALQVDPQFDLAARGLSRLLE